MSFISWTRGVSLAALVAAGLVLTGCGGGESDQVAAKAGAEPAAEAVQVAAVSGHDHGGWWCTEHGIPEGICARCNSKVAAEFQQKGDWCEEHGRPESQCFLCHPELEQKFAAQYEAKFGSKPPTPEPEEESET